MDQDTTTTTSANSSSSDESGSSSNNSDESGNSSSSSSSSSSRSIAGMTSATVRSTMPQKNLTASRKKRSVPTAIACRQLAAATSKQTRQSAWAMKPTESRRQAVERRTPAAKVYPRARAAADVPSKTTAIVMSKSSRPKGTTTSKRVVKGGDGGSGRVPSRKRETPRVSASRHMAWERQLRASTTAGASNPDRTRDAAGHRGRQKADNNDGGEGDGRPSLGTWEKTIVRLEILKKITGKGDEELQWLCSAKQGGGIQKSETRRDGAETDYHRLLFQESMLQAGMEILKDRRLEVSLKTLAKMGGDLERLTKLHEQLVEEEASLTTVNAEDKVDGDEATTAEEESAAASAAVMASLQRDRLGQARVDAEVGLHRVLEGISGAQEKVLLVGHGLKEEVVGGTRKVFGECESALETAIGITGSVGSARELVAPTQAANGLRGIEAAVKTMAETLSNTKRDCQTALEKMELWRERKEALPEHVKLVADDERAWFDREAAANEQALRRMRSLMPVGVTELTLSKLEQRAIDAGSLYPRELSLRLKENRLLQWTVTHPDDIARSNFLHGSHAHFFTNLDKYDLVEMRAILACLPAKFEVDDDGRKAAWRAEFVQRAKGLVAQERGDMVRGGWDPEISARRQVRLPELSAAQARREEYFYPTAAEVQARVDKLRERQRRLEVKQVDLAKVGDELLPEARREYEYVLEDSRHPFNRATCKPVDLRRAREEAKSEVTRLLKEAKRLEGDVASAARALQESPSTVDGTLAEAAATRRLLSARKLLRLQQQRQQRQQQTETTATATASVSECGPVAAEAETAASTAAAAAAAATSTSDGQVEEEDEEEEEVEEVEEGSEVEGAFDPNPELRSRLSDKSRSLRFVTADEEAKIRKEELARVFSCSSRRARRIAGANGGKSSTNGGGGDDAEGEDETAGGKTSAVGGGHAKGRIKAFGAVLEKTLSKTLLGRAPATAPARTRKAGTPPRPQQRGSNAAAAAAAASWEPKSKHFRALRSATVARSSVGSPSTGCPPLPPPPPPMLGMLSQIRARGGGGPQSGGGQAANGIGGLLAEIRTRGERGNGGRGGGGGGSGGGGGTQSGGCQAAAGIGGLLAEIRAAKRG